MSDGHEIGRCARCLLVIDVIDGQAHTLRRVGDHRFTPPALCGHHGRSIYLECDQLALADIGQLWDLDLGPHDLAVVRYAAARHPSPYQTEGHMSSVMRFDNGRCRSLDVVDIADRIRGGTLDYPKIVDPTWQAAERAARRLPGRVARRAWRSRRARLWPVR